MKILKRAIRSGFDSLGFDINRKPVQQTIPVEFSKTENSAFEYVRKNDLSMVSDERLYSTIISCKHVIEAGVEGDFVECGVFKGGNAIIAKMMFDGYGVDRKVWLFDTFLGMTKPSAIDVESATGKETIDQFLALDRGNYNEWVYCPIDKVRQNFSSAGLLDEKVKFIQGDVLDTLNRAELPSTISVLRLDTDWYESTKMELEVLYPRLSAGGVLIIDDYGCFRGAQRATDEYFLKHGKRPLLNYIDYTGRVGVKP